ncbi:MAG: PEPxxWA-CTERM sorting domain-containing protein [Polyangiaceae bacterium]
MSLENLTGAAAYTPYHVPSPLGAYAFSPDAGASWNAQPSLFGLRIEDAPGAVPEPATWAMMILGLGLTAAAMRRSPQQARGKACAPRARA